ncbi:hypothetical protein Tco_0178173 [Tanacetum coccineum]
MSITKEQHQALDDALVPREQRLRIRNCNYRLSTTFKPKEPTFQVALDVLSLTPFYQAFLISASVPAIYMHEFWATVSYHKHCIKFKMNKKNYSFDLETFRDMLQICPNLPGQKFKDPPFEEEILAFIRELGYPGDIKSLSDVKGEADQAPTASPGKRLKATAKVAKLGKKKQPTQGLETLSEIALSKAKQMKIVTKRSKTQFHSSHANGSGTDEGTGVSLRVPDVPTYRSEDEQISWKSSDEDDDNEVSLSKDDNDNADNKDDDGQDDDTESDNDSEDFVHPKFSTHDEEERQDDKDKEEEGSDMRVQTPSHFESIDDETYDEVNQRDNVEGEEHDEEEKNEEEEVNELYRDMNVNLERKDTEMTDALQTNVQGTQVIEDTQVIIIAVTPEVQQQSSYVSSGFISNMLNPKTDTCIDSILNLNTESTSLVDVPVTTNAEMSPSSVTTLPPPLIPLFEDRVKALEDDFLEFKRTNQFAEAVSSILGIVHKYLANQMNEAQADNEILPKIEKFVNDQLKAEVLIRSSNEAKASHVVAANLSELELKKILINKMENNKSIDRSIQQKILYKALVDTYETDKDILETYGDTVIFKRRQDDEDEDEEPSAGSNRGSKRRRAGKEPESNSAPKEKTSKSTGMSKEGSKSHQKSTGNTLARNEDPHESFNELIDTPLDFSAFVMNRLKVDTLTSVLLSGPTYELMKVNRESARDVYSKYRILAVTKLKIIEWHNYKHLDWIIVRRNDDKLQADKSRHKKNILMRIDELHKFSDGTLNDVRSALDDILKRIRMEYLPQTV